MAHHPSHPRSMLCATHGTDGLMDCEDCLRARNAKAFWGGLSKAIGFDLGPARRRSIAHLLDHPYGSIRGWQPKPEERRGRKTLRHPDVITARLAIIIADRGPWPPVFPLKNHPKSRDELLEIFQNPGFPRFLLVIWEALPRDCRRSSEFQFLRAAIPVLRRERPDRSPR